MEDYPYIRQYAQLSGATADTLQRNLAFARAHNAPQNAVSVKAWEMGGVQWVTTDTLEDESLRERLGLPQSLRNPALWLDSPFDEADDPPLDMAALDAMAEEGEVDIEGLMIAGAEDDDAPMAEDVDPARPSAMTDRPQMRGRDRR